MRVDMDFSSSVQLDVKLNTRREIPYLKEAMCYFVYYINILMRTFLTNCQRFLIIFRRFLKIFRKLSVGRTNVQDIFRKFLKIAEDVRR